MTISEILKRRLINQQIAEPIFQKPEDIVNSMVAMQAQDFTMAKWAIGLRLRGINNGDVERAFNEGKILRTHLLRPTWHFVSPADIRWLLLLTAPRVHTANAFMYRSVELDTKFFKRSHKALTSLLEGENHLTRAEIKSGLEKRQIFADGFRLAYILMCAELDGVICSGIRKGNQFTYALLEERVPPAKSLNRKEALAELTNRYFTTRGPATLKDFTWWNGLTVKEATEGISTLSKKFLHEKINGHNYIFADSPLKISKSIQSTFLMPDYDEYGISYKIRDALASKHLAGKKISPYSHWIVLDGKIEGTWQRILKRNKLEVKTILFSSISKAKESALKKAVKRYCSFFAGTIEE